MDKIISLLFLLITSSSAVIFNCDFGTRRFQFIGEAYFCRPTVSTFGDAITLTEVRGNHLESRTNEDVRVLYAIDQQAIPQLPNDLEQFFPNLVIINWWHGNLTSITADFLKPFPNLLEISLHSNQFTTLDGDSFQNTKLLRYINFADNQLTNVGPDFLANLDDLRFAYFHNNPCISMYATSSEQIPALIDALETLCPPLTEITTTTTIEPSECSDGCADRIEVLETETRELRSMIVELERQVREMAANPCSC